MKKILHSLLAGVIAMTAFTAQAQLPDGSVAPNFTVTDINGNSWTLYDMLDEGKSVILDFSATWCPPCWSYHNSGAFSDLWDQYGPDGTGELYIMKLESDPNTTLADLQGTGSDTMGDWVTGTNYIIVDDAGPWVDYQNNYYPTIYTVCPSRILTETGQASAANHYEFISANCAFATEPVDANLLGYSGATESCGGDLDVLVTLQNMGTTPLTSANITVTGGGVNLSYDWTGNLDTYETAQVNVGSATISNPTNLNISVNTTGDANAANNTISAAIGTATATTSLIKVELRTDNYGEETGWEIRNASGSLVQAVAAGSLGNLTDYEWWVSVPSTGCYTFTLTDEWGDGLNASQWGGENGNCEVKWYNDDIIYLGTIYENDGTNDFEIESAGFETTTMNVGISEQDLSTRTNIYPNPFNVETNLVFSLEQAERTYVEVFNLVGERVLALDLGMLPAGEQFVRLNFSDLSAGLYMVNLTAGQQQTTKRVTLTK